MRRCEENSIWNADFLYIVGVHKPRATLLSEIENEGEREAQGPGRSRPGQRVVAMVARRIPHMAGTTC